ncbi:MAG: sugar ABC transporter ATP-binding protein [Planctomycetota bacterium]|jgi:ribose transport system ATP-binding protein
MDRPAEQAVLEAQGITKSFPGVLALRDVDFSIFAGKVNVLVGENGAGKSTLMNVLSGVYAPDAGTIRLAGREVSFDDTREAQRHGIAIIHQELNLVPYLSVAENIFLGREFQTPLGLIDYRRTNAQAAELLQQLQLPIDPRTPVASLRVGQQQVVEIAKALFTDARVLIMDEPTSAISDHEVEVLFGLMETLKARGVAIVYVSHKLDELFRIGDWITVLRDGRFVMSAAVADVDRDEIVRHMVGREATATFQRSSSADGSEILRVEHLRLRHCDRGRPPVVDDVSFDVRRGEVLGVFGLMGAGRTELLETIFGLHPNRSSGRILVEGVEIAVQSPDEAIQAGIGLAPEDRKAEGLVLAMNVQANVTLASLDEVEQFQLLSNRLETALANRFVDRLDIKTPSTRQTVRNLSGGNQQKVVLAKWLATKPRVLLLDEPTRGIDVGAKREIYRLVDELTCDGLGIVMVSSELPEILAIADRIMVMSEGRKTAEFYRSEATEERIIKAALPGSV